MVLIRYRIGIINPNSLKDCTINEGDGYDRECLQKYARLKLNGGHNSKTYFWHGKEEGGIIFLNIDHITNEHIKALAGENGFNNKQHITIFFGEESIPIKLDQYPNDKCKEWENLEPVFIETFQAAQYFIDLI